MIKIAVVGACGRMGREILKIAFEDPEIKVVGGVEAKNHKFVGKDLGDILGLGKKDAVLSDTLASFVDLADVVINFATPEALEETVRFCVYNKLALVIGTTGLSQDQIEFIKEASSDIPIVYSPNMSVGVNLLFKLAYDVARILGSDYDVEIVEVHHRFKKDSPSGTALKLAENIALALGRDLEKDAVYGRKGMLGERKKEEIGIFAVRAGDVVGEHTVIFATLGERVELTHRAHSRATFARGAIRAAKWVYNKPEGLYSMHDVLGLS